MAKVEEKKRYGYGKRPLWHWIVLYLIIGGIVYFLVYYLFLAPQGVYKAGGEKSSNNSMYNYSQ